MSLDRTAVEAAAKLHHAYFLGLQLMVSTREGEEVMGDWMFRLFRRQHLDKFLSSFSKLGLEGLPDAVACAQYHVLSNGVGGVAVEYMYESDTKAWVRFRYPRWMYAGPTICGVTDAVSKGFLRGWYAHNGVSLENPRLGYVCVSEDMTGEFGLCGYFKEFDHDLSDDERLTFAKGELPPPFVAEDQPKPPAAQWDEERLAKANRNYAVEYIRNGISTLTEVIGEEKTLEYGRLAARLIGAQYYAELAETLAIEDAGIASAVEYLAKLFSAMGDTVEAEGDNLVTRGGLRILRGLEEGSARTLFACWTELWAGAMSSRREMIDLTASGDPLNEPVIWSLTNRG